MALSDLTASAVLKAIEEFDRLGRDAFLKKYGFWKGARFRVAKKWSLIRFKGYSRAAHGYLPGRTALTWRQFSGGEATVEK
jgi:5-methylcytosine-specific restriction protein A